MRVLIVKTSSMGDVIHTLPALTDAGKVFPEIKFDWLVEENFAEIPTWHPLVEKIIPVALRRWRKNLFSFKTIAEITACRKELKKTRYDLIIDAQGLLKSVWLMFLAKGMRVGLNWQCAREPLVSLFYQKKHQAGKIKEIHAVQRMRNLFSSALSYSIVDSKVDYGIDRRKFLKINDEKPYILFLHGTTWPTKHWPEVYWSALANRVNECGLIVKLPWGNVAEQERAQRIAASCKYAEVLPRMQLADIAAVLAGAKAAVAVDTGLCHLAAALNVPTVSLYGPTNPILTGALGESQVHLSVRFPCAPCLSSTCSYRGFTNSIHPFCFTTLQPERVWESLKDLL